MADQKKQYVPKAPEPPKPKPDDIEIKSFSQMALPGAIQGQIIMIVMGLGSNNEMYTWNDSERKWYER